MSKLRIFVTSVITLALAFGVWSLAVSFTPISSSFSDGDVLQASDLNGLFDTIDNNFSDAETQINANETGVSDNATDIGNLQSDKADVAGDTFTGRVDISADAESDSDTSTVFRVDNTSSTQGSAAVFTSNNNSDNGAVSIKQQGAGPALSLKSGTGPLIAGVNGQTGSVALRVDGDGSIQIGDMNADGTGDPALHLDAANGTITNDVGSGLPVAFGTVESDGSYMSGTTNWSASYNGTNDRYAISIDGENYYYSDYTTVVTPVSGAMGVQTGSNSDNLLVYLKSDTGSNVQGRFAFVTYAHP